MGDATREEGVGHGGRFVGVRVEGVAGLVGEVGDLLQGDGAQLGAELVPDAQLGQALAEGCLPLPESTSERLTLFVAAPVC